MILVVKNGTISERGTYKQLLKKGGAFAEFLLEYIQHDLGDFESGTDSGSEKNLEELKEELEIVLGAENAHAGRSAAIHSNIRGLESDGTTSNKQIETLEKYLNSRRESNVSKKSKDANGDN